MTVYSYSRINTFKSCPMKFKFQYVDRIKTDDKGIEAFMGSRVHDSM
ncbi:MAG: PD-(D/E)XK nuclease family protein [Candidatus Omnitrophica bacterium]|nr:PD-(D/E)XK nuclease family protein [Candidatus Omnitrophota bacterium]MBU1784736.1 PD-(D/E)XK nuclease family protein [Candidatus Omnitrophota bacterium]MBU1852344.1 PD-(D/E)XK nuclease family protein [Candidatus Omnitrophota bacterium]